MKETQSKQTPGQGKDLRSQKKGLLPQLILPEQLGPALCVSMPRQLMDLIVWPRYTKIIAKTKKLICLLT